MCSSDLTDVRMKLAIAREVLGLVDGSTTYIDVSVPQRPVAGMSNPQVSG